MEGASRVVSGKSWLKVAGEETTAALGSGYSLRRGTELLRIYGSFLRIFCYIPLHRTNPLASLLSSGIHSNVLSTSSTGQTGRAV